MQIKKQQLELHMKQQTGSKLGKENVKAVYCHTAYLTYMHRASLVAQLVKNPYGIWETWVWFLGLKDPLEKGEHFQYTYFSILARRIPWREEPGGLQPMGSQRVRHGWISKHGTEYIMQNARLDEAQAGIKIAGRNINNLRYADDTTLMAESKED